MAYTGEQPKASQLASPSLSNLLVNGGFEIWQRGVGAFTANAAYTADRWQIFLSGTDTISVSKDTTHQDTPSAACAAITFTLGSGGGSSELYQKLEDFAQLKGQTVSVSMRVNQSVANACRLAIEDGVSSPTLGSTSTVTGSYVTLTATATIATNATTVQIDLRLLASATIYADNAMLVIGAVSAAYVPLTTADEFNRCLRYYEVIGPSGNSSIRLAGIGSAAQSQVLPLRFQRKAVTPTLTKVGTWNAGNCNQPSATQADFESCNITTSVTNTAGYDCNNPAGCFITVEANP